jgi:hypothetical protein
METPHESVWLGVRGWHRPRARWFVLAGLVVVVLAIAVVAAVWLRTYSPLALHGGATSGGNMGNLPISWVRPGLAEDVLYVSMNEPGWTEFGFDVTNDGRVPVTVEGLATDSMPMTLAGLGAASERNAQGGAPYPDIVPFKDVEIAPGDKRYLSFRVQIDKPCSGNFAPGSMMAFETVDLRYRYLRVFERDVTVDMPFTVGLVCGELPKPYDG